MSLVQRFVWRTPGGNFRRMRSAGEASARGDRNAVSYVHPKWVSVPKQWQTRMPHRNHLRWKRTLTRACTGTGSGRCDTLFAGVGNSVHLGSRRWRESDEDYDAIAAGIHADGVDVDTGFPVVK